MALDTSLETFMRFHLQNRHTLHTFEEQYAFLNDYVVKVLNLLKQIHSSFKTILYRDYIGENLPMRKLDEQTQMWIDWYRYHHSNPGTPQEKLMKLYKGIDGISNVMLELVHAINHLEGRHSLILSPSGVLSDLRGNPFDTRIREYDHKASS